MYRLFVVDFSPNPLQSICIFITRQNRYVMANEDIEIHGDLPPVRKVIMIIMIKAERRQVMDLR